MKKINKNKIEYWQIPIDIYSKKPYYIRTKRYSARPQKQFKIATFRSTATKNIQKHSTKTKSKSMKLKLETKEVLKPVSLNLTDTDIQTLNEIKAQKRISRSEIVRACLRSLKRDLVKSDVVK